MEQHLTVLPGVWSESAPGRFNKTYSDGAALIEAHIQENSIQFEARLTRYATGVRLHAHVVVERRECSFEPEAVEEAITALEGRLTSAFNAPVSHALSQARDTALHVGPRIYVDYSFPVASSHMPTRVWTEKASGSGVMVVGLWEDCGTDNIKLCASEVGAEITAKAWRGEMVDPASLPLGIDREAILQTKDAAAMQIICQDAAHAVALHLDIEASYLVLADAVRTLHPGLATLLLTAHDRLSAFRAE